MRTLPRSLAIAALVTTLALGLSGCAETVSYPEGEPDAVGVAKAVVPSGEDTVSFILEGYTDGDYFYNASITIGPETVVGDAEGRPLDPVALLSGTTMSVWVDACAESYPVQCTATHVRVEGV